MVEAIITFMLLYAGWQGLRILKAKADEARNKSKNKDRT